MSARDLYKDLIAGRSAGSQARGRSADVSRRTFLSVSASATGGLLLAVSCKGKDPSPGAASPGAAAPAADVRPPPAGAAAELNAWIHIDHADHVTLRIAESEMGQGILTALAMILAEELDADWSKVSAEHAPCDARRYGRQGTGGSSSIRQGWEPMKKAGAAARAMLIAAAAERLGVPASELTTEPCLVVHAASGRKLPYGTLVAAAARLQPPAEPTLKDPKTYRLVGKSIARLDAPAKITGQAVYGLDVRVPGMKFAVVARPPALGSSVASFDAANALAVPGVEQVVQVPAGVAVIATNTWAALRGRDTLTVQWTPGTHPQLSTAGITETLAAALRPSKTAGAAPAIAKAQGKAEATLARSKRRVVATYEAPYLAHATMEPLNCTVHLSDGKCKVWTGTQGPTRAQSTVAEALGLAPENVEIITTFLGGGFGRRSQADFVKEAAQVAKHVAAPVQLVWTREDDLRAGFYRPAAMATIEAALDARGFPSAWVHRIASPSILEQMNGLVDGVDQSSVEGVVNLPYSAPPNGWHGKPANQAFPLLVTWANPKLPLSTWFWRSVGSSQNAWMVECFVDELARAAGHDPLQYRQKMLPDGMRHRRVLDEVARLSGWGKPVAEGHALGVAVHESFGSYVAVVAEVSLAAAAAGAPGAPGAAAAGAPGAAASAASAAPASREPRVHKLWCVVDAGRVVNPNTVAAQMESGLIYGLSAALYGKIDVAGGAITTASFAQYPALRLPQCPDIEVMIVDSKDEPGGIGEPSTPVVAPAVCNALLALTGQPVRKLPIAPVT